MNTKQARLSRSQPNPQQFVRYPGNSPECGGREFYGLSSQRGGYSQAGHAMSSGLEVSAIVAVRSSAAATGWRGPRPGEHHCIPTFAPTDPGSVSLCASTSFMFRQVLHADFCSPSHSPDFRLSLRTELGASEFVDFARFVRAIPASVRASEGAAVFRRTLPMRRFVTADPTRNLHQKRLMDCNCSVNQTSYYQRESSRGRAE